MHIYAISDLHLSFSSPKPMDVFGDEWHDHAARLAAAWQDTVQQEDVVLIPGDISWAMQLSAASPDLAFIGALPGKKVLLKGNHDYWWNSIGKVRAALPPDTFALQNQAMNIGDYAVCGTRGWLCPGSSAFTEADEKIYERELIRLELSLSCAEKGRPILAMLHFPPFSEKAPASGFTELLSRYGVTTALYGHLHGAAQRTAFEGVRDGVAYRCVAGDYLSFRPLKIV